MKLYSGAELHRILNVVNDPQYNAMRLKITTDTLEQGVVAAKVNQNEEKSGEITDAELGGNSQRGTAERPHD